MPNQYSFFELTLDFTLTFWDLNLNNANYYYYLKDRQSHLVVIFWVNGSFEWARTQCSWRHTLGTEIDPGKVYLLVPSSSRLKSLSCVRWWQRKFPFRPSRRRAATPPHRRHAAATSPLHRRHAAATPLLSLCRCCSAGARGAATIRSSSNAGTLWSKRFEWIQKKLLKCLLSRKLLAFKWLHIFMTELRFQPITQHLKQGIWASSEQCIFVCNWGSPIEPQLYPTMYTHTTLSEQP